MSRRRFTEREVIVCLVQQGALPPTSDDEMKRFNMAKEHWQHVPAQYAGRWSFDFDEKQKTFFVHNNGHRICDAEDSEVAAAICAAHNHEVAHEPPDRLARWSRNAGGRERFMLRAFRIWIRDKSGDGKPCWCWDCTVRRFIPFF